MSIHTEVEQTAKISSSGWLSHAQVWTDLGWGLCFVLFLGFSPRLFHLQEYVFFFLLGLGVVFCLWRGQTLQSLKMNSAVTVPFLCFVGWVALTIPFSIDPLESLKEWQKVVAQLAVFYGTCLIAREQKAESFCHKILAAMVVGTILCCTYSLVDFVERGGNIWDRNIRAGFPLADGPDFTWLSTNVLMVLPVFGIALYLAQSALQRLVLGIAILLSMLGLVFSYTRGVWLGFLAQIVLAIWLLNKKMGWWILGVGGILGVGSVVVVASQGLHRETFDPWTVKARLAVWEMSVVDVLDHPLTGVGYGVPIFQKRHAEHIAHLEMIETGIPDIPEKPHNWYLMIAMGTGFPGLALFIWLLAKVWESLWTGFHHANFLKQRYWMLGTLLMATGFFVRLFFDDSFGGSHSYLFWIFVGLAIVLVQQKSLTEIDPNPSSTFH